MGHVGSARARADPAGKAGGHRDRPSEIWGLLLAIADAPVKIRLGERTVQGYTLDAFPTLREQRQEAVA